MINIFNDDFQDFIKAFIKNEVKYVLVGGYSVVAHGYRRSTGDMDLLVERSVENYHRIMNSFNEFGMPVFDMTQSSFLSDKYDVFSFGRPPAAIDIMTKIKGAEFDEIFLHAQLHEIDGIQVRVIHLRQLIKTKKASGRHKDLDDIENLENNS